VSNPSYFDGEAAIIQQLKTKLQSGSPRPSDILTICSGVTLSGSVDLSPLCPLVVVAPGDTQATGTLPSDDGDVEEDQVWEIALVVAAKPDHKDYALTCAAVEGGRLKLIREALRGFQPLGKGASLVTDGRPRPSLGDPRFDGIARFFINFKLTALP
jgi:hypothetical protein